jgi:hypothetical protein
MESPALGLEDRQLDAAELQAIKLRAFQKMLLWDAMRAHALYKAC